MARDRETLLQSLNEKKGKILRTKDLEALNVSKHFKNKFVEEGVLKKLERGKYQVIGVISINEKVKHLMYAFDIFSKNVIMGNYVEAYKCLVEINANQVTTKYDEHNYIYFSLLRELIGDAYDFSMLEKMSPTFQKSVGGGVFLYYESFRDAVLEKNYEKAYKQIKIFQEYESKVFKKVSIGAQLFRKMTEEICELKQNEVKSYFTIGIITDIKHKNYQKALKKLEENEEAKNIEMNEEEKQLLIFLLKRLIYISANPQEKVTDKKKGTPYFGTIYNMLESAIKANDFNTALKKVNNPKYKLKGDAWIMIKVALESVLPKEDTKEQTKLIYENKYVKKIDELLECCIKNKTVLSKFDLDRIKELLLEKLKYVKTTENTLDILSFVDFNLEAMDNDITEHSFQKISNQFKTALHNGDYIGVDKWFYLEKTADHCNYSVLEMDIIRCLLNTLKDKMASKKYKPILAKDLAFEYRNFYQLIEEEKWEEAINYYRMHSMEFSEEGQKEILGNLVYLWKVQKKKESTKIGR